MWFLQSDRFYFSFILIFLIPLFNVMSGKLYDHDLFRVFHIVFYIMRIRQYYFTVYHTILSSNLSKKK